MNSKDPDSSATPPRTRAVTRKQFFTVGAVGGIASVAAPRSATAAIGRTIEYWVAAVPVDWNIVPTGRDPIDGRTFPPSDTVVKTTVYREYTRNWGRRLDRPEDGGAGIQGPLIRAQVGDTILVHFKNLDTRSARPHSMHFHGVEYDFASDGSYIPGVSGRGANVKPGESFTYRLTAGPESAGVWPYHDHSPSMMESIRGGMYGVLSVSRPDERRPDREFVVFFASMGEFMTINGRAFVGNTPVFEARVGDRVQWDVLTLGDEFHTFHIHGHRWKARDGRPLDTVTVGPAESFAIRFTEDKPGTWLYHCHVESHMMDGMIGTYRVRR